MSEFVFNIGQPGVGAFGSFDLARIRPGDPGDGSLAQGLVPQAPVYPVALKPGGDPNSLAGLPA